MIQLQTAAWLAMRRFFVINAEICLGNIDESAGSTITWNINADSDATVTLVFRMASCNNTIVIPTINRLKPINDDVHVSEFENVYGETDMGHWSWLYFFNNERVDENGTNMWQWMAQQSK